MNKEEKAKLIYPELSYQIVGAAFKVFNGLGFGQKEAFYQRALLKEFESLGLKSIREKQFPVLYKKEIIGTYIPDFLINDRIVVELKIRPKIGYVHIRQVVNYLRSTNLKLAIIVYFTRDGVKYRRIINAKK